MQVVKTKPVNAQKKYAGIPNTRKLTVLNVIKLIPPMSLSFSDYSISLLKYLLG